MNGHLIMRTFPTLRGCGPEPVVANSSTNALPALPHFFLAGRLDFTITGAGVGVVTAFWDLDFAVAREIISIRSILVLVVVLVVVPAAMLQLPPWPPWQPQWQPPQLQPPQLQRRSRPSVLN